jgi:predicted Zn finger-like uncharacterized protein
MFPAACARAGFSSLARNARLGHSDGMRLECPACAAAYDVPDTLLKPGRPVRCVRCNALWQPEPPMEVVAVPPARDIFPPWWETRRPMAGPRAGLGSVPRSAGRRGGSAGVLSRGCHSRMAAGRAAVLGVRAGLNSGTESPGAGGRKNSSSRPPSSSEFSGALGRGHVLCATPGSRRRSMAFGDCAFGPRCLLLLALPMTRGLQA